MKKKHCFLLGLAVILLLIFLSYKQKQPPKTIEEAIARIVNSGYCVGYANTVSRNPIPDEEAASLITGSNRGWKGKIRVLSRHTEIEATVWGSVLLYGDNDLIKEITGGS